MEQEEGKNAPSGGEKAEWGGSSPASGQVFDPVNEFSESCFWDVQTTPYTRCWSLARKKVNDSVVKMYGQHPETFHTLLFTSGMNTIAAIIDAYSRGAPQDSIILHGSEMYSDVWYSAHYICGKKIKTRFVNVQDDAAVLARFQEDGEKLLVFIIEVCTNASGQVFNFDLIPQLHHLAPDCLIVVDNTWLSPVAFNPFKYGVDVVVESTTKHISGCCAIGGIATGSRRAMEPLSEWLAFFGIHVPSEHCLIIERQLASVAARHRHASSIALETAQWMEREEPSLANRVLHPLLPSHPCHRRAKKFFSSQIGPTVFLFHVSCSVETARAELRALSGSASLISNQTSYGAPSSRVDPWPTAGRADDFDGAEEGASEDREEVEGREKDGEREEEQDAGKREEREGNGGVEGTWVRLAVGYEADGAGLRDAVRELVLRIKSREHARMKEGEGEEEGGGPARQGQAGEMFGGVLDEYVRPSRWRRPRA